MHRALVAFVVCVTAPVALTQTVLPNHPVHSHHRINVPPPLHVQYFYLLRLQVHLDREADKREQRGLQKEAKELREHVQGQLHFTDAQAAIVREAAKEYDDQFQSINFEIAPLANADRDWVRANGRASGPPPNRDQVKELGQRRRTALDDAMNNLNSRLGTEGTAQVQTYLARIFAPHEGHGRMRHLHPPSGLHAVPGANPSVSGSLHSLGAEAKQ